MRPYLEKTHYTKKGWWSGSRCRPRVQAPILKNNKKPLRSRMDLYIHSELCTAGHLSCPDQRLSLYPLEREIESLNWEHQSQ
jgi:hypothetical protein